MKKYLAFIVAVLLSGVGIAYAAGLIIPQGGTGQTSFPLNTLLYVQSTLRLAATSSNPLYVGSVVGTTTAASSLGGALSITGNLTTNVTGTNNNCLQVNTSGVVSGTGSACGGTGAPYPFNVTTPTTGNATSTLTQFNGGLTAFASTTIGAGGNATGLTISGGATTTGKAIGTDTVNNWTGVISPTRFLSLSVGTTTAWTGTTTDAYVPSVVAPFGGTIRNITCIATSTGAVLGIKPFINNSGVTPAYIAASTTGGNNIITSNNTFVRGDRLGILVGTSTAATTLAVGVTCTVGVTETP